MWADQYMDFASKEYDKYGEPVRLTKAYVNCSGVLLGWYVGPT
jgi:hypothetical protein